MTSRIAKGLGYERECPRCGTLHRTHGSRYCRKCYRERVTEKAHAEGVPARAPIPEIELGEEYGSWVTVKLPPVRKGGEAWGTLTSNWPCRCLECGEERVLRASALAKGFDCPVCRRRERVAKKKGAAAAVIERKRARARAREKREKARLAEIERQKQLRAEAAERRTKHPLYDTWIGMRDRCLNSRSGNYQNYGGRGIAVHPAWAEDFAAFRDYCEAHLGPRPDGMSIDRKDNEGDYEPGNIRWATPKMQARNTRVNVRLTIGGVTRTFLKWAEQYGLTEAEVTRARGRLANGWDAEEALTAEDRKVQRGSGLLSLEQIEEVEARGLTLTLVRERISRGWSLDDAMTSPRGTVKGKEVFCWMCDMPGHLASSHPDYQEWLARKMGKTTPP